MSKTNGGDRMSEVKPYFLNIRTNCEFPIWKRFLWLAFGKRIEGRDSDYKVVAYTYRDITYIYKCENINSQTPQHNQQGE